MNSLSPKDQILHSLHDRKRPLYNTEVKVDKCGNIRSFRCNDVFIIHGQGHFQEFRQLNAWQGGIGGSFIKNWVPMGPVALQKMFDTAELRIIFDTHHIITLTSGSQCHPVLI